MLIRDNSVPAENKTEKDEVFSKAKTVRQHTTIYQPLTTNSPSKNHVLHSVFRENPSKNTTPQKIKKTGTAKRKLSRRTSQVPRTCLRSGRRRSLRGSRLRLSLGR